MRDWLRKARKEKRLTMREVGQRIGMSENGYAMIESGDRQKDMNMSLLVRLSDALGMPIAEIIENERK